MAKKDKEASDGEEAANPEGEGTEEAGAKKGFVSKLLGNKKLLIIAVAVLLVVGGGGAGAWFFLFSGGTENTPGHTEEAKADEPIVAPQVAFFDMPDIVVNIQSAEGAPAYLKLSVSLELAKEEEKTGLQPLAPRIVDQFQSYLRELRIDDLKGSAGVMRLKEELLRRVKVAAAPYHVRDVLLKEMIVQ